MAHGTTTSIRLPPHIREELDKASHTLHRGKNWIIIHALEAYLSKLDKNNLVKEAQRQSILASQANTEKENDWKDNSDTSGWI